MIISISPSPSLSKTEIVDPECLNPEVVVVSPVAQLNALELRLMVSDVYKRQI